MNCDIPDYIINDSFKAFDSFLEEYQNKVEKQIEKETKGKKCMCSFNYAQQLEKNCVYTNTEGYICCLSCGFVFDIDNVDSGAEWSNYIDDKENGVDNTRCQVPIKDCFGKDVFKTYISSKNSYKFINLYNSLNRMNLYSQSNSTLNKTHNVRKIVYEHLHTLIPDNLINRISNEYMSLKKIYRADTRLATLAALTYFICQEENIFKSIDEIAECFKITAYQITTMIHKLSIEFQKYINNNNDSIYKQCDGLSKYIEYNQLILLKKIIKTVIELNFLKSYTPQTIIGCSFYFLVKELKMEINVQQISELLNVSTATISKNFNILENNKQSIFNYIKQHPEKFQIH